VAPAPALVALGRALFSDGDLSEPKGTSCASCHDPSHAFSGRPGDDIGVPRGSRPGHFARRSAPSLLYLKYVPRFHFYQDDEALQPAPFGGYFWDGRADELAALVRQPLLNPDEMNNRDGRGLAAKIGRAAYRPEFERAFPGALGDGEATLAA